MTLAPKQNGAPSVAFTHLFRLVRHITSEGVDEPSHRGKNGLPRVHALRSLARFRDRKHGQGLPSCPL